MENILKESDKIAESVAIEEIKKFVDKYTYEEKSNDEIKEDYPQLLRAIKKGLLIFDEDSVPVYTLAFPLKNDEGEDSVKQVNFKTRIKPTDLARITKGLNVQKQQMQFSLKCLSHIIGEPIAMLDRFEKFDYKVIEQVSTVFF